MGGRSYGEGDSFPHRPLKCGHFQIHPTDMHMVLDLRSGSNFSALDGGRAAYDYPRPAGKP
jgi:hypothetical protein